MLYIFFLFKIKRLFKDSSLIYPEEATIKKNLHLLNAKVDRLMGLRRQNREGERKSTERVRESEGGRDGGRRTGREGGKDTFKADV